MSAEKKISPIIMVVITIVILLSSAVVLFPIFEDSAPSNSNLCSNAGCFWNASRAVDCTGTNVTAGDTTECTVVGFEQPLGSLFERGATLALIFGAVVIMLTISLLAVHIRKKRS